MFKSKTVDGITAKLTKIVTELRALETELAQDVREAQEEIAQLREAEATATAEALRAQRIAKNVENLLS